MDRKTTHRINISILCLMVFVLIVLAALHPIYSLVWLLLCGIVIMVLAQRRNPLLLVEQELWQERIGRLREARQARKAKKVKEDPFSNEFKIDHILKGLDAPFDKEYIINKEDYLIGSEHGCDLVLSTGGISSVSRKHCRITYRRHSHAYFIEDLNSTNGTYVGTKRLELNSPEHLLEDQNIVISRYRFHFTLKEKKEGEEGEIGGRE